MKQPSGYRVFCAFCITLCAFSYISFSQTFTARPGVKMAELSNGYYEYLPEGYNGGSQYYPVIIFCHGMGEVGNGTTDLKKVLVNGTPRLINEGTFPKSFTVNGKTFRFIVITPQFSKGSVPPSNINEIIDYLKGHYRIDENRIYLTGLSMGGGIVWNYCGNTVANSQRIAAIVPVCGASDVTPNRANNMAIANLPIWATHNRGDRTVYVERTLNYIAAINSVLPPPNPLAKMTIFEVDGHDAWTKTYDPAFKVDNLNVYEWMLKYQRHNVLPVENLVFRSAESQGNVSLSWNTSREIANQGFTVERSADGLRFDSLSFVPAQSETGGSYSYSDRNPLAGKNYYRLKIISQTGTYSYSDIVWTQIQNSKHFSIFPNPVTDVLQLKVPQLSRSGQVRVIDLSGRVMKEQAIPSAGSYAIPLHIPAGVYTVALFEDGKIIYSERIVKR